MTMSNDGAKADSRRSELLRCAVIGLGWWGRRIVEDVAGSPGLEIVAGVDPDPAAESFAAAANLRFYGDLADCLEQESLDAVIITSPHREHLTQMQVALDSGLHIFCEKPFAADVDAAADVLRRADELQLVVGIGHERRFEPPVQQMRAAVERGDLGEPLLLEGTFSHDKFLALPADNWRLSPEAAPVGPLSATGIHLMDLSIAILGPPVEVWANLNSRISPLANGAALAVGIGFERGGSALISAVLTTPFAMHMCLYGTHGWIEIRDRTHPEAPTGWDVITRRRGDDEPTAEFVPAFPAVRENLETWARAARGEGVYPVTTHEILNNVRTFHAITEAALSGGVTRIRP